MKKKIRLENEGIKREQCKISEKEYNIEKKQEIERKYQKKRILMKKENVGFIYIYLYIHPIPLHK